jgi:FKBP-type peptidyl-prolyl cis-trans isomerase
MLPVLLLQAPPVAGFTTPGGVQVTELQVGTGLEAAPGRTVAVLYTGWLWERGRKGLVFDTNRESGDPLTFRMGKGKVIQGWEEGLRGLRVGGRRRLLVPPGLAYGPQGTSDGTIPPGATLCFEVELVAVK